MTREEETTTMKKDTPTLGNVIEIDGGGSGTTWGSWSAVQWKTR